jgi:1-acyl-sn-glycerol-3-phosphate acyltransferase
LLFHVLQVIAYNLFGYAVHRKTANTLNFFLVHIVYILLNRLYFSGYENIPQNKPLIIVSNHQSMFDISPIIWAFRKHHVKFIAKAELGNNLPSISYNLKKGGSALIDRNSGSQAIKEILKLGRSIEKNNWAVCIFPEGTRSKNGKLKGFHSGGLKTLLKASPSAAIVPFVINGNYKLLRWGGIPLNIGLKLKYTILKPIDREGLTDEEILQKVKDSIQRNLDNN